jgi:hypothetical protein
MSGILDKKSRLFDYVITSNGREQIARSEIKFKYATVSDSSIVYLKDFDKTEIFKSNISGSEDFYFPFEASTNDSCFITDENPYEKINKKYRTVLSLNNHNSESIEEIVLYAKNKINNEFSISAKIKSKNILLNKNYTKVNDLKFKIISNCVDNKFIFGKGQSLRYNTVKKSIEDIKNCPVISYDKRFYKKNNFKKLYPVNSDGVAIFSSEELPAMKKFEESQDDFFLKSFSDQIKIDNSSSKSKIIIDYIKEMNSNKSIFKKEYHLIDSTEADTFLLELFEINHDNFSNSYIEKIIFINIGSHYDNNDGTQKDVYLAGKIINSRDTEADISGYFDSINDIAKIDVTFSEYVNTLSTYFSFINMFIIVAE